MSSDAFDQLMGASDPAMVVVTTVAEDEFAGCLVGFHSQSSIDPEEYCVWLSKANHTYRVGLRASHFAIHFLTAADLEVAEWFGTRSGETSDKFAGSDRGAGPDDGGAGRVGGYEFDIDEHGLPLLRACPNRMVVERLAIVDDGGDHACFTTSVRSARSEAAFTPLRSGDVAHLDPGRSSESRAVHP